MDLSKFDDYVSVSTAEASIAVSRHGAHLLSWEVDDDERFLVSEASGYGEGIAIRGGIPICYPWFGKKAMPQHGWARILEWELTEKDTGVVAERDFDLEPVEELPELMLKSHVKISFELDGRDLVISAWVTNTGEKAGRFDLALHSYFTVSDINKVNVTGLGGANYTQYQEPYVQEEDILVPKPPLDRVYARSTEVSVDDLKMVPEGFTHTVVWNPGPNHGMPDLKEGDEAGFICVEAMADGQTADPLEPGETREFTCRLSV